MTSMTAEKLETTSPPAQVETSDRIERIRRRYQHGPCYLSVERGKFYTESWKATEGKGLSPAVRVARAMQNVYEHMTHHVDPEDRIAGYWCEHFLGMPVDVERGVFNSVLEAELDKAGMLKFRAATMARGMAYMLRKGMLGEFIRNQRQSRESGAAPLNMDFKTMSERRINPYQIRPEDKKVLLHDLLPYWKGRTVVDRIEAKLLDSGLLARDMRDFLLAIPGNTSRQVFMLSTCSTIASYHAHMILDLDPVLEKGLTAIREEIAARRQAPELDRKQRDFLESLEISLDGVIIFARRLAEAVEQAARAERDPERKARFEKMAAICRKAPLQPAETFEEAVQALWTVKTAVEVAHPVYLHCFGRLDQTLRPYYEQDLAAGRTSREDAVELLSELLLKIMSQNIRPESNILSNFYHRFLGSSPVTLGGITPDGADATNEVTYLFLEAAHRSKAITNVSVRVHESTPDEVLLTVAEYLRRGTSSFSVFNDEINIEAMKRRGFSQADANDYAVMGCVETTCPGKTGPMSANALQLNRLLDLTLHNGDSKLLAGTLHAVGPRTGTADSFQTFDDLLSAFYLQAEAAVSQIVKGSNLRDTLFAEHLPAPLVSAFVDGPAETGRDVTEGGARYVFAGISMVNAIANLIDSLYVIQKLVFERKLVTLPELVAAVDANFAGREDLHREIKKLEGKWGNGDPDTDALARRVMKQLFDMTYQHRTVMGGPFVAYIISMITHTIDGRLSLASPDGRKAARPYAASCNPYNVERQGVTAALRSVAALPFEDVMGCAVNVKFHPTAVGTTKEGRKKWAALVRAYFKTGGAQLQPTVASAEELKAARDNPEAFSDLIVKVGGYSAYFTDLGREIQQEIIERTEHGEC